MIGKTSALLAESLSLVDFSAAFLECSYFLNRVFSFCSRGLTSFVAASLSGANTFIPLLLGRETIRGLYQRLSSLLGLFCHRALPTLSCAAPVLYPGSVSDYQEVQTLHALGLLYANDSLPSHSWRSPGSVGILESW